MKRAAAKRCLAVLVLLAASACGGRAGCSREQQAVSAPPKPKSAPAGDPALPGLEAADRELTQRLESALRAKGSGYEPRTHHLHRDGSPKYVNRLIFETSPYLLQHAHNPVNWYPWGEEAFERARREGKPVLVSIGYSTCHWCHVMERESFEDEEIAAYLNQHYVAIKVDREERPDVDDVYMKAVQMLTGRGGWPMTVVLTPDKDPFFGGTYFPARDGDRGAGKGFFTIMRELEAAYQADRGNIVARAQQLSQQIEAASASRRPGTIPGAESIEQVVRSARATFDADAGGFGHAPKFPRPVLLDLLLRYHRRSGDAQALAMVTQTLDHMASGGIYDHIGGGFHRYATDRRWLVPHFEKMLYDNAQLASTYLGAYQVTGAERFAEVARETLHYVAREMTAPGGGFYSASDADSPTPSGHEEEGYFFTWTPAELTEVLGADRARIVSTYFAVSDAGNFEGRNILNRPRDEAEVAAELGIPVAELRQQISTARAELYSARSKRPPPHRDDKILTSWNGLMISAFARAALVLGDEAYAQRAVAAADFILEELRKPDGKLLRSFKDGRAKHGGYLDDYAFLTQALLDLFEATSDAKWLREAVALQGLLDQHFWDDRSGGYFMTSDDHERLLARDKPSYDGAEPSGNAVALSNLLRLAMLTSDEAYRKRAERGFAAFSRDLTEAPDASPRMLAALDSYLDRSLEVFIVEPSAEANAEPLVSRFRRTYLPNAVFAMVSEGSELTALAQLVPALAGKQALEGRVTAYVCERGRCELPTSNPAEFARQLARVQPLTDTKRPSP